MIIFPVPPKTDNEILDYLYQLSEVLEELNRPELQSYSLEEWHYPPDQLTDGMVVSADGTDWNPGSGQGIYRYVAATNSWVKLG